MLRSIAVAGLGLAVLAHATLAHDKHSPNQPPDKAKPHQHYHKIS